MAEARTIDSADLTNAVPGAVTATLPNGDLVVAREKLIEFSTYLRDKAGYDYLSNVTGVDYLGYKGRTEADRFEVVYHVFSTKQGGGPVTMHVRAPASDPSVPSVISVWPGTDLQEREIWDLYGIRFPGHPNLRRILLWEGFDGHPMRKDWKEAYFEDDKKPFKSRHPDGHHTWAETRTPWAHNVAYASDFDPQEWLQPATQFRAPVTSGAAGQNGHDADMKTERIVVNMGPQHPSTHGVFRMLVALEGETITALEPEMGYLHRNHEKIGERNTYIQNIPYTDRLDYISSMSNNFGYVLTVEKLLGAQFQPTEYANYLRILMVELTRVINHMWAIGFLLNDLGAFFTPALYAIRERELILDLFEAVSGSRMMCNYMRFGGVARDLPAGWLDECSKIINQRLDRKIDEMEYYLTNNEILVARCKGVGYLSPADAVALSTAGPVLRASGVPYDVRKADPYSIYDRFDFKVACFDGCDVYARYQVRIEEMRQSVLILKQVLQQMPKSGEIQAGKKQYSIRVPEGTAYGRVEGPKGELGFYVVSDGTGNPWRYRIRAPSYISLNALGPMCVGYKVADSVIVLGSIDIVLGETDR
ncbi:MAG: NADH-quinone oxidoreductase subunit D [Anaerolineae bacterium]|nr:NADH-quinone oxidoreductase subunit D [Anaerolineae bacterium]